MENGRTILNGQEPVELNSKGDEFNRDVLCRVEKLKRKIFKVRSGSKNVHFEAKVLKF